MCYSNAQNDQECLYFIHYARIDLLVNKVIICDQWRNQTRASQGIAQASSYTALPSALRPNQVT